MKNKTKEKCRGESYGRYNITRNYRSSLER